MMLLGVVIAVGVGWLRIPMLDYAGQLAAHDQRVAQVIETRTQIDEAEAADRRQLLAVLEALQRELSKTNRVQQIRTCAEIVNPSLREMCLR